MRTISSLLYAVLLASLVACGSKKDDKADGGGGDGPNPGKPTDKVEVTVETSTSIKINGNVIESAAIAGKTAKKTVEDKEYSCSIPDIPMLLSPFEIKDNELHLTAKDNKVYKYARVSGDNGQLFGEWKSPSTDNPDGSGTVVEHLIFPKDNQNTMSLKWVCSRPK